MGWPTGGPSRSGTSWGTPAWIPGGARPGRADELHRPEPELVRRTGLAAFDFGQAADRAALGHLLGLVADRTFADSGLLISALVTYRHGDSPAAGFFSLAAEQGLIRAAATAFEREAFWSAHVRNLQGHYGRKPAA
jgi:hypothetical protein